MSSRELAQKLYYFKKPNRWTKGIGEKLPDEYKKFWKEWKLQNPSPVHYIPKEGKYERKEDGTILPVQNVAIPLKYPKELDSGLWGGEAVIRGFYKKHHYKRRVVRYWVPQLKKSVVYSEILDKYMKTIVTDRTLDLIHKHYGFDHYILNTPACDLRSLLAVKLKREMLINLADKSLYPEDPVKRDEVYAKYEKYLKSYTRTEIEWYGLDYNEACKKLIKMSMDAYNPVPLKIIYRENLINSLKEKSAEENQESKTESETVSWLSRLNPFSSKSKPSSSS